MGELLTGFIRRGMGEWKKGVEIALREARIIRLGMLFEWEAVIQRKVLNIDFPPSGVLIPDCPYRAWNNYVPALFDSVKLNYHRLPFLFHTNKHCLTPWLSKQRAFYLMRKVQLKVRDILFHTP